MSFEDLLKQANQGDSNAQYIVGNHYNARGDYIQAIKYYQSSACIISTDHAGANKNHPEALNHLGWYYQHGYGVNKNREKAFQYYLLSAEQKCPAGYANVAYCYKIGYCVPKDLKKAIKYYRLFNSSHSNYFIDECELLILKQFSETLNEDDYLYAYPLYIKHNHKDLRKLKKLINKKYVEAMRFMPPVLSDIIISFIL